MATERPSERAMRLSHKKAPDEPVNLAPGNIRELLAKNGWREQDAPSEMRSGRPDLARVTWWNRGVEVLLLVEHTFEDGAWASAWVCIPATSRAKAARVIARKGS